MSFPSGWNEGVWLGSVPWRTLRVTLVTVTTSATPLPSVALSDRKGVFLWNSSATRVYVGDSAVETTFSGSLGQFVSATLPASDQVTIYGRVAAGSTTMAVWEYG